MMSRSSTIAYRGFFTLEIVDTPVGRREVLRTTDSVVVLVHDVVNDRVLLVRQRRAAMATDENPEGWITEAIAGRMDRGLPVRELIAQEAWEEAGVRLEPEQIELLNHGQPMAVTAGVTNERSYLAYAPVRPEQIEAGEHPRGLSGEGEEIFRVFVPVSELETVVYEDVRVFALCQYLLRKRLASDGDRLA
ncbi:MAG: hypothetical protein KatS3mg115_2221 [Candidatus Poribacteria bacterium]|nr:MAG: hypothetical protein KatS3mg115_2221 [Candidatus Poribacteria bacterium]